MKDHLQALLQVVAYRAALSAPAVRFGSGMAASAGSGWQRRVPARRLAAVCRRSLTLPARLPFLFFGINAALLLCQGLQADLYFRDVHMSLVGIGRSKEPSLHNIRRAALP